MNQMCSNWLPWNTCRRHQTFVSPCPVQSRVGVTEGIQENPCPYHKPSPFLSYSSHVLSFLPWTLLWWQGNPCIHVAGPRKIISLQVVWISLWRRRDSWAVQWERWVQERQGCSLGQAAVSASSAETQRCLLLLLQQAECGSAVGPCPGTDTSRRQCLPSRAPHTDALRQRTTQLSPF